jgi:hypothetical protein
MQTDRERYLPEIIEQHDGAPGYWVNLMALNARQHPQMFVVMNLAVRVGQVVAAYYKKKYKRPRASLSAPGCCRRSVRPRMPRSRAAIRCRAG